MLKKIPTVETAEDDYDKHAFTEKWVISKFDIFTDYVVNIKDTSIQQLEISQQSIKYFEEILLSRHERQIYLKKYNDSYILELRGKTTNIIFHNDEYEYDTWKRDDEFDMYILLKQIDRICGESLDVFKVSICSSKDT